MKINFFQGIKLTSLSLLLGFLFLGCYPQKNGRKTTLSVLQKIDFISPAQSQIATPLLAQTSSTVTVTIRDSNGIQVHQPFNSSRDIDKLVGSIYAKIKPPGEPLPIIKTSLGSTNFKEFQNLVKSKGISSEYYEFPPETTTYSKNFAEKINSSSVYSRDKNYGVVLSKSGYKATDVQPFKVTQIANNTPVLRFTNSEVILRDQRRISFILDIGNLIRI